MAAGKKFKSFRLYGISCLVHIFDSTSEMASAAARQGAKLITGAINQFGGARVLVATGNSQVQLVDALVNCSGVEWNRVELFHMDEYIGLPPEHPSSFRFWIKARLADKVQPIRVHYLKADALDIDAEIQRYSELLLAAPIHLAFVGFGENGHIAFNDPHVADFNDPVTVKRVVLDERCRRQQASEGHFPDLDSVPREALTVTCPGLFRALAWICCVSDARKAQAVREALEGPISTACPASLVRRHANATVFLDRESASLLQAPLKSTASSSA